MIDWKYKDYRPDGFECWEAVLDTHYSIAVSKLTNNGTGYTVRLYYKDMHYKDLTELKKYIEAADWDAAKAAAINEVRDYIERQANYWYSVRERFERIFKED